MSADETSADGTTGWAPYLGRFHAEHAGITEQLFAVASAEDGMTPYGWLLAAAPEATGMGSGIVLDLACGSAPL